MSGPEAGRRRIIARMSFALALIAAVALRIPGVSTSAVTFHPVRQYPGLVVANARYIEWTGGADSAEDKAAVANSRGTPKLEPRLIESVVGFGYVVMGGVRQGLGGVLSSLLWVVGGVVLFRVARRLASTLASGVAFVFHLFLGYGIIASRSIQPDSAMVTVMLVALLCLLRHDEEPSARRLALAALVAGAAVQIKPFCIFFLTGVYFALAAKRNGLRNGVLRPQTLAFLGAVSVPFAVLYLRVATSDTAIPYFAQVVVDPKLLVQPSFWRGWLHMIEGTVGVVTALAAVASIALTRGVARTFMVGALAGYAAFGLVFTYTIHTHDYYQMPFVPIVGLGVGLTADAVVVWGRRVRFGRGVQIGVVLATAALIVSFASSTVLSARPPDRATVRAAISKAQRIGDIVSHSSHAVLLSPGHSWPLRYNGGVAGPPWPYVAELPPSSRSEGRRAVSARLAAMIDRGSEWFIVTDLDELARQPALGELLERQARRAADGEGFIVYDLTPRGPVPSRADGVTPLKEDHGGPGEP